MMDRTTISCFCCGRSVGHHEVVEVIGLLYCRQCAAGYRLEPLGRDRWPDKRVSPFLSSMAEVEKLSDELKCLISEAQDEKPLQGFFERNTSMLVQLFRYGHGRWVFPRPRLGSEHIPDFMVCGEDSAGPHWHLIELESPTCSILRKDGQQKAEFTHAEKQVKDWRIWLRKNVHYAQNQLGYVGLDSEFYAVIVMGRRKDISPEHRGNYRELSSGTLEVMSYDRVLERVAGNARGLRRIFDSYLEAE